jgi:hypothetical protein
MSDLEVKQTSQLTGRMSANDPKRTLPTTSAVGSGVKRTSRGAYFNVCFLTRTTHPLDLDPTDITNCNHLPRSYCTAAFTKFIEFAQNNTKAAFDFVQKLSGVKSPSDFIELSTDHSRKQFETLTEQTKALAALAQKVALATVEPLKTGVTKAYGQPT